jgi:hypothetical protein
MSSWWADERHIKNANQGHLWLHGDGCHGFSIFAHAQSAKKVNGGGVAKQKLIGAWHLMHIDAPGPDGTSMPVPQPKGMLIYSRDGLMSVQLMYPESANTLSNEYVLNGI